jgi:hypothetical protein
MSMLILSYQERWINMGGSLGGSKSGSNNSFSTDVWGTQGSALGSLYDSVFKQLGQNQNMGNIGGQADSITGSANDLINSSIGVNDKLANGGAYGDMGQIRDQLLNSMGQRSNMGSMYESIVGGSGNTYVDPLIEQLRSDSQHNVNALQGGNALDAAAMGQSGSSRQAMQDAMFANQANKDLMTTEAGLRAGAYDTDLQNKMGIAQMADSNRQSEQDRLLSMLSGGQQSLNSAKDNSSLLDTILNSGNNPYLQQQQAGWNPLNNASNIIGNAIMTGSGGGSSKSKGFGSSGGMFG